MVAAGLECDIRRGAGRAIAGGGERVHLGVRSAESFVESLADDFAVADDDAADHRVRLDESQPPGRQRQRVIQIAVVVTSAVCHVSGIAGYDGVQSGDLPPEGRSESGVQMRLAAGSGSPPTAAAGGPA